MVNPWRKYKNASVRKKQALHSLIAGLVLFCLLYIITKFTSLPLCPINRIFGIQCFGCGLTRGFIAILRLDLAAAVRYHVLSIPLFIGILLYSIGCVTDIIFDRNDIEKIERYCTKKHMLIILLLLLLLSAIFNRII